MNKTLKRPRDIVCDELYNRPNMWCVIDSTLNTAYTPAREGRTAHKGPAESDNPKSDGCIPEATTVQGS